MRAGLVVAALVVAAAGAAAGVFTLSQRGQRRICRPDHAYADVVLSDGAIGYWRLNEASGDTARNLAPAGLDGKYVGKRVLADRSVFRDTPAASFGGDREYVSIPDHAPYQRLTRWSVEAWIDPAASTGRGADVAFLAPAWRSSSMPFVLGYGSDDGAFEDARHVWAGFYSSTGFYRQLLGVWSHIGEITGTWSRAVDTAVLPLGKWTYVVGTFDGSTIRLFKNGTLVDAAPAAGSPPAAGSVPLYIGSRWWLQSLQFFTGSVDDVALYPKALDAKRIEKHYQAARRC
jgi:concanavalin A-like lectin/glucanase superfamily protein